MSLDFFRIERGLEIDGQIQYIPGTGIPGTSADTIAAPIGTIYVQTDALPTAGNVWSKVEAGSGSERWQRMASEQYVNNALGATVSWREPAVVRDSVSTSVPVGTPNTAAVIDGLSITDGQRVLFSNVSGGNGKNVYVYNFATGIFNEDINQESIGDSVYVSGGTSAGRTYVFNGTDWVQSDQATLDEDGFIRSFIGKTSAGNELPSYTSTNFVGQNDSLRIAVSKLDAEVGPNVASGNYVAPTSKVNANIQAIDAAIGLNVVDGNFITAANKVQQNIAVLDNQIGPNVIDGNFIDNANGVNANITAIDSALGAQVSTGNVIDGTNKIGQNIQAIDTAIGADIVDGTYVDDANTLTGNIQALDTELGAVTKETSATNVTATVTLDSVVGIAAKWIVRAEQTSAPGNVSGSEILAMSNGTTVDYTKYALLQLGSKISGLSVVVTFNAGAMELKVASTAAVNVTARRVSVM